MPPKVSPLYYDNAYSSVSTLRVTIWLDFKPVRLPPSSVAKIFESTMALAADCVIAEVGEIVEAGEIDPDEVMVPGIVVDLLVLKEGV